MSPWYMLCCAAIAFYMAQASPHYKRTFAILCGFFVALAATFARVGHA